MSGRERIAAAIAGGVSDRAPIGAWGHAYREEWDPVQLAEVTVQRAQKFGWDYVKLQPRATCFAEALGADFAPAANGRSSPIGVQPAVITLDDWGRLAAADHHAPALADQTEALRLVVEKLGPDVPVIQTVFSPLSVAGYLVGKDKRRVVRELRQHPDVLMPAMERIATMLIDFVAASLGAGAAGIFYAVSGYAAKIGLGETDYRRLALQWDKQILATLPNAAWFNVLHLCGSGVPLSLAKELPVQAISWSMHNRGNVSLAQGHEQTRLAAMGGVDKQALLRRNAEAIADEVRAANQEMKGRNLIVAPGCSVPPWASEANLQAMSHALD